MLFVSIFYLYTELQCLHIFLCLKFYFASPLIPVIPVFLLQSFCFHPRHYFMVFPFLSSQWIPFLNSSGYSFLWHSPDVSIPVLTAYISHSLLINKYRRGTVRHLPKTGKSIVWPAGERR